MVGRDDVLYVDVAPLFPGAISGFNYSVPSLAKGRVAAGARSVVISSYMDITRPVLTAINFLKFVSKFLHVLTLDCFRCRVIFVFHCTWVPIHWIAGLVLKIFNIPYFHTPRGDLSKEALKRSYRRKKIAYNFFVKRFFRASCGVNFLSPGEQNSCVWKSDFVYSFICPNGVDTEILDQFNSSIERCCGSERLDHIGLEQSSINIGFLGRFDVEIKGVDRFIEWTTEYIRSRGANMKAMLAGPPSKELDAYLRQRRLHGCKDKSLVLTGPCFGAAKYDFLRSLDVLVIPSRSEGVPAVFFEALSCVPVVLVSEDIKENVREFLPDDDSVIFVGGYEEFEGRLDDIVASQISILRNLESVFEHRHLRLSSFNWARVGHRYREMAERGLLSF